ncbi:MAG TPA: sigma-70 family RNA polymerase sigma factor, partial [Pyrinomonadaceae bacterium]|nr:sigma-70 family RNA polymerase sigma factor [Pyrinomonadaceae bacterium]
MTAQALLSYEHLTDLQLASWIVDRDPRAVRLVTQRNNQRLFRVAWSIVRNRSDAEDVVQETYVRAFAAISTFNGLSSLSTWLTRIAINEALARKRSSQRRVAALNANSVLVLDEYREKLMDLRERRDTPETALMRKQLAQLLERAIAMLPEAFRTTFVLREIEGLSVNETADVLQIPPVTVKTRYLRARK